MLTEAITTTQVASVPSTVVPEPGTKVVTPVHASMFQDSDSIGTMRPDVAGPSHAPGKELSVGSREVNSKILDEVYVPRWNYKELFIEFRVGTARQACLSAKVRMHTEFCLSERGRFESELEKQTDLLKTKDKEVEYLKAQLFLKEAEAAEAIRLCAEASNFEAMERSLRDELSILNERNAILEKERNALDWKATDLEDSVMGKKPAIRKAIEKGMQDGLAVRITHCTEGRTLADVAGYNPSAEANKKIINHLDSDYKKQASMVEGDKNDNTSNSTSVRELGNVSLQCPKLTETNYTTWALMMETIMKAYGIWETIVAKEGVTTNKKKENTSKAIIFQTLPQDVLMQVAQYSTAKEVLIRKLLNSAPNKFLPIVATIEQYQDLDEMSFEEAIGRLTAYEERIKSQDTLEANDQDKLLMASSNNKTYGKWRGKDFNKECKDNMKWKNNPNARRASTSQGTKDKSKLRCYECGEHGHFAKECTKWKYNKDKQEESHLIYDTDTEPTLL
nr:zinc finger, CCHC-type [Tanacetum cinerariifolium]